jgi:phosphoglycolate phosphatase
VKVLIFDFDGVIVDSNRLKRAAWDHVFSDQNITPRLVSEIVARNKGDRHDIVREILAAGGATGHDMDALVDQHSRRFNTLVQHGLLQMGVSPRSRHALVDLSEKYPLYINSATPQAALEETVARLRIGSLFAHVYGSPCSKEENFMRISEREGARMDEMLFVGDSESDWIAAKNAGVSFVGFVNGENNWSDKEFPLARSLEEINKFVK